MRAGQVCFNVPRVGVSPAQEETPVTRAQLVALVLLGVLFLIAVTILTIQVLTSGGVGVGDLPG